MQLKYAKTNNKNHWLLFTLEVSRNHITSANYIRFTQFRRNYWHDLLKMYKCGIDVVPEALLQRQSWPCCGAMYFCIRRQLKPNYRQSHPGKPRQ